MMKLCLWHRHDWLWITWWHFFFNIKPKWPDWPSWWLQLRQTQPDLVFVPAHPPWFGLLGDEPGDEASELFVPFCHGWLPGVTPKRAVYPLVLPMWWVGWLVPSSCHNLSELIVGFGSQVFLSSLLCRLPPCWLGPLWGILCRRG